MMVTRQTPPSRMKTIDDIAAMIVFNNASHQAPSATTRRRGSFMRGVFISRRARAPFVARVVCPIQTCDVASTDEPFNTQAFFTHKIEDNREDKCTVLQTRTQKSTTNITNARRCPSEHMGMFVRLFIAFLYAPTIPTLCYASDATACERDLPATMPVYFWTKCGSTSTYVERSVSYGLESVPHTKTHKYL